MAEATQLPASLEILSITQNQLARIQEFTFLTALEQLRQLDVDENPFVDIAFQHRFEKHGKNSIKR